MAARIFHYRGKPYKIVLERDKNHVSITILILGELLKRHFWQRSSYYKVLDKRLMYNELGYSYVQLTTKEFDPETFIIKAHEKAAKVIDTMLLADDNWNGLLRHLQSKELATLGQLSAAGKQQGV